MMFNCPSDVSNAFDEVLAGAGAALRTLKGAEG